MDKETNEEANLPYREFQIAYEMLRHQSTNPFEKTEKGGPLPKSLYEASAIQILNPVKDSTRQDKPTSHMNTHAEVLNKLLGV